eukprot:TRINITY_DN12006_c0_g1_i1.p1 TRINITY_DN12006_c0_g1~~TRINITY_DN12006_c0_g1_i1.p1  ORF type:complete len:204 (+),score=62.80 TRINITY_DN12006_c0_g1_i1:307-918(+)
MAEYVNRQLEEMAKKISDSTFQRLLFVVERRLCSFESRVRKEVMEALMKFTREVKSSADAAISERIIRAEKQLKEKLKEEKSKLREEYVKNWVEEKSKPALDQSLYDTIKRSTSEPTAKPLKKSAFKFPESSISSLRASKESSANQSLRQNKLHEPKLAKKPGKKSMLEVLYKQYTSIYRRNSSKSGEDAALLKGLVDTIGDK